MDRSPTWWQVWGASEGKEHSVLDTVTSLKTQLALVEQRLSALEANQEAFALKQRDLQLETLPSEPTLGTDSELALRDNPRPMDTARTLQEDVEKADVLDYQLGNTLWDAPSFIGLKEMGGLELSMIMLFSTLLNAFAQLYLVWVLMDSDSFIRTDKWQRLRLSMQRWRDNEAHQYSQVDASGTSLAARVCGLDDALSVAGKQSGMLTEINNYVGLEGSSMEPTRFPTGPWLCTVCLFLWVVVIVKDLRQLATYLVAMLSIPRGKHTRLEDGQLVQISRPRVVGVLLMGFMRLIVALALCYAGVLWLANTSSVVDLILNAAALTFVMDLDELLLETTVPAVVHRFVADLKPVSYRSPVFYIEALLPMVLIITSVTISVLYLIAPNIEAMRLVKEEMCKGLVDFAISSNGAGFAAATLTTPFFPASAGHRISGIRERAVQDLRMNNDQGTKAQHVKSPFAFVATSPDDFKGFEQQSLEGFASMGVCMDKDTLAGGQRKLQYPFWFTTATAEAMGTAPTHYNASSWRCSDHRAHCDNITLIRTLCPITCGCHDPLSGQIFRSAGKGVPQACIDAMDSTAKPNQTCEDRDVVGTPEWERWWNTYKNVLVTNDPSRLEDPRLHNFIRGKLTFGCNDTSRDPYMHHGFCHAEAPFLGASRIVGIRQFCLRTCCSQDPAGAPRHPECPASCPAGRGPPLMGPMPSGGPPSGQQPPGAGQQPGAGGGGAQQAPGQGSAAPAGGTAPQGTSPQASSGAPQGASQGAQGGAPDGQAQGGSSPPAR